MNEGRADEERPAFIFVYEWADDTFASTPIEEHINSELTAISPVTCQGVAIQDGTDVSACDDVGKKLKDTADQVKEGAKVAYETSVGWLYENTWAIGIIYLIFGPIIAFFGGKWYPIIVATLAGLFTCSFLCSIALSSGWMATRGGATGAIIAAIVLGIIAGYLVR